MVGVGRLISYCRCRVDNVIGLVWSYEKMSYGLQNIFVEDVAAPTDTFFRKVPKETKNFAKICHPSLQPACLMLLDV